MHVALLCMDELVEARADSGFSALTGLLIPIERAHKLRHQLYRILGEEIEPNPRTVAMPPELKYSDFLRHRDDARKLQVLGDVAQALVSEDIKIYRVGYTYSRKVAAKHFARDPELRSILWLGLWATLQPELRDCLVIPVLDAGFDKGFQPVVDGFSSMVRFMDVVRTTSLAASMTPPDSANLLEVLYADSKYSVLIQLADLASGLLRSVERPTAVGSFKAAQVQVASHLRPAVAYNSITDFDVNGSSSHPPTAT